MYLAIVDHTVMAGVAVAVGAAEAGRAAAADRAVAADGAAEVDGEAGADGTAVADRQWWQIEKRRQSINARGMDGATATGKTSNGACSSDPVDGAAAAV